MKAKSDFPRVIREFPDDNSGDITLPEHNGIEQKTLDELHKFKSVFALLQDLPML